MKHISKKNWVEFKNDFYPINSQPSGIYTPILNAMLEQFGIMLEIHNKVHVLRFDLRQYHYTEDNQRITVFNRKLFKWLKRHYQLKNIGYTWVREQERAKQQHYHFVLFLDGNKIKAPHKVVDKIESIWEGMSGSYWRPENNYSNMNKGDKQAISNTVYRISYLAKARGKGYRNEQAKDYSTSRLTLPKVL